MAIRYFLQRCLISTSRLFCSRALIKLISPLSPSRVYHVSKVYLLPHPGDEVALKLPWHGNIIIELFKTFQDFWTQLRPFPLLTFNTVRRELQDLNAPVLLFLQSSSLMPSELVCNSLHNMRQDRDTLECPGQKYISRLIKGLVFGHYMLILFIPGRNEGPLCSLSVTLIFLKLWNF